MQPYRLTEYGLIMRVSDGMIFPRDTRNSMFAEFERWEAAGGIVDPAPTVPVDLVAYAKDASWKKEVGGIVIAGIPVATDDRSQLKILGSRVAADADPNWSTNWDAANDQTFPLNSATMIMISDAVAAHVNRCFSIRAAVKAAIAAGTITTTAEIDAAFA